MTERSPSSVEPGRSTAPLLALLRGVIAAGLGLGALTVLVLALWICSPEPASGPGGALHAAAGLWLLAHGAELIRADTLSGAPAPIGLVPLLLAMMPMWLVHRAVRDVLEPDEERPAPSTAVALVMVVGGYLLVGAVVAGYAWDGALSVRPSSLLFPAAVVVVGAAAAGAWTAAGRPVGPLPSWAPVRLHEALARDRFGERAATACRSALAGTAVLLGGGALLVAVALIWHAELAQQSFVRLSDDWAGRVSVMLLAAVLVPNAAVWAAAYGLGPGFALGTASTVTPLAFSGSPALPAFPLLAAVPAEGPGTAPNWAAGAVPVAAGVTVAWFTVRRAAPAGAERAEAWNPRETALTAALGAVGCGVGTAVLAAASGGPLGTRALAEFGPVWWLTGAAALGWTVLLGVPGALLLRAWRLREHEGDGDADGARPEQPEQRPEQRDGQEEDGGGRRWWRWYGRRGVGDAAGTEPSAPDAGPVSAPSPARVPVGAPSGPKPKTEPKPKTKPDAGATASVPASSARVPGPAVAPGPDEDDDFEPYDFLPTDPWHERTARPGETGPSGNP
ncbi:cell division protein PerM [Streptomyces sp. NPDC001732]